MTESNTGSPFGKQPGERRMTQPKGANVKALGGFKQTPGNQSPEPPATRRARLLAIVRKRPKP